MAIVSTFRRSLALIDRQARRRLLAVAVAAVLAAALDLIAILLLVPFLAFLGGGSLPDSALSRFLAQVLPADSAESIAVAIAVLATGLFVVKAFVGIGLTWIQFGVLNRAQSRLVSRILRSFADSNWLVQQNFGTGGLLRTVISSSEGVMRILASGVTTAGDTAVFLAVVAALVVVDPLLAVGSAAYLLVAGVAYIRVVRAPTIRRGREVQIEAARINDGLVELVGGIREIAVRGTADAYVTRIGEAFARNLAATRSITVTNSSMRFFLEVMMIGGVTLVIAVVVVASGSDTTALVSMGVLLAGGLRLLPALNSLLVAVNTVRSCEYAVGIIERELAILGDSGGESGLMRPICSAPIQTGQVKVLDVSFRYPGRSIPALRGVTFEIAPKAAIGIVGRSGAGKSTLMDLLLGLLDATTGRIEIDGVPLGDCRDAWQAGIGFVPQQIFIAEGSLADNIVFSGRGDGNIDRQRLDEVVALTGLDALVSELPDGLAASVGERGLRLSGGQRQRVGLARALYRKPRVLFLDEATSAMDTESEHDLTSAIEGLRGRLTTVVIAHRLSTVKRCDEIVFLDRGAVLGVGTFDGLSQTQPEFARLVELGSLDLAD